MKASEFFTRVRRDANVSDPDQVLAAKLTGAVDTVKKDFTDQDVKTAVATLMGKSGNSGAKSLPSGGGKVERRKPSDPTDTRKPQDTRSSQDYSALVDRALEAVSNEQGLIDEALVNEQAEQGYELGRELAMVRTLATTQGMRQEYKSNALRLLNSTRQEVDRVSQYSDNPSGLTDDQELELLSQQFGLGKG